MSGYDVGEGMRTREQLQRIMRMAHKRGIAPDDLAGFSNSCLKVQEGKDTLSRTPSTCTVSNGGASWWKRNEPPLVDLSALEDIMSNMHRQIEDSAREYLELNPEPTPEEIELALRWQREHDEDFNGFL